MAMTALVLLVACGGARLPPLPSKGGAPWREIKSEHITLWTNLSTKRGYELVQQMEQRRQVIARAMNRREENRRIFAVAVDSSYELRTFFTARSAVAVSWPSSNPSSQPGILLSTEQLGSSEAEILNHELAHALSYSIIPQQPLWLAEGLASYFEGGELDDKGEIQLGRPSKSLKRAMWWPLMSAHKLLSCDRRKECRVPSLYAGGWMLLSYLINHHYETFSRYLQRLNELPREQHLQAWEEVFHELPPVRLDAELADWRTSGTLALPRIKVTVRDHPATERALGDADVLAMRGLLYTVGERADEAKAAASAALALDRAHLLASLVADGFGGVSLEDARRVAAASSDDWRAHLLLARKLGPGPERNQVLKQACSLGGTDGNIQCIQVFSKPTSQPATSQPASP